jgi:hypothetical protein
MRKQLWVAKCHWTGRKPFYAGTFMTDQYDNYASAEAKARALAMAFFADILPTNTPPPGHVCLEKGSLILDLENDRT